MLSVFIKNIVNQQIKLELDHIIKHIEKNKRYANSSNWYDIKKEKKIKRNI